MTWYGWLYCLPISCWANFPFRRKDGVEPFLESHFASTLLFLIVGGKGFCPLPASGLPYSHMALYRTNIQLKLDEFYESWLTQFAESHLTQANHGKARTIEDGKKDSNLFNEPSDFAPRSKGAQLIPVLPNKKRQEHKPATILVKSTPYLLQTMSLTKYWSGKPRSI